MKVNNVRVHWNITGLYFIEYVGLLAGFPYICLDTAKVGYKITTPIPIDYKLGYTIPEIVSLLFSS